jgi:hypothetical protein
VIFSDVASGNAAAKWQDIEAAAATYPYAEQESNHGRLLRWPNSKYELFGNNSNTFIRHMARAIGRDADVVGGDWRHPGNIFAVPVPHPGYVPTYSPWEGE